MGRIKALTGRQERSVRVWARWYGECLFKVGRLLLTCCYNNGRSNLLICEGMGNANFRSGRLLMTCWYHSGRSNLWTSRYLTIIEEIGIANLLGLIWQGNCMRVIERIKTKCRRELLAQLNCLYKNWGSDVHLIDVCLNIFCFACKILGLHKFSDNILILRFNPVLIYFWLD